MRWMILLQTGKPQGKFLNFWVYGDVTNVRASLKRQNSKFAVITVQTDLHIVIMNDGISYTGIRVTGWQPLAITESGRVCYKEL